MAGTGPGPAGVIHDLGYRGYDGPRLGAGYATRSLFVQSLRAAFGLGRSARSKVVPMLLLAAMCLPAVVIVVVAVLTGGSALPVDYPRYLSGTSALTGIFLATQAPVALSRDLRFMTVPLYFSRPISRGDYVRAKVAAMVAALFVVTGLPVLILYVGALLAGMPFGHNTQHAAYGLGAAVLYSVVYASIGLAIAAATPRRGFGVAAVIGVLTITGAVAGVVFGVLRTGSGLATARWAGTISPSLLVDAVTGWLFHLRTAGPGLPPSTAAGFLFFVELLAVVAGCYLLLHRRYRKI